MTFFRLIGSARRRPDPWLMGLLVLMSLAPAAVFLAAGWTVTITSGENFLEWYPFRLFVNRALSEGFFPAWCPDLLCGFPFIAWSHASALSPTGMVYYLLSYERAAVVGLFIHLAVFNLGAFYLYRKLRITPRSAFAAAILAGFALFLSSEQLHILPRYLSLSFAPLLFGLAYRLLEKPRLVYLLALAATAALQVFGGQMEIFVRTLAVLGMGLALYVLFFRPPLRLSIARLPVLGLALTLAGLLALPQLLPTYEFADLSTRPRMIPYQYLKLSATGLATTWYIGLFIVMVPLNGVALIYSLTRWTRDRIVAISLFIFLICLMISADALGILRLVQYVPVLGRLTWHSHMLLLANIFLGVLAGKGLDHLQDLEKPWPRLYLAYGLLFASLVVYAGAWRRLHSGIATSALAFGVDLGGGLALLLLGAFAFRARPLARRDRLWAWALVIIAAWLYFAGLLKIQRDQAPFADYDPAYAAFVSQLPRPARVQNLINYSFYDDLTIPLQAGAYYSSQSMDFYFSIIPRWTYDFYSLIRPMWMSKIEAQPEAQLDSRVLDYFKTGDFIQEHNLKFINFLNIVALVSDHENFKFASDYQLLYSSGPRDCAPTNCLLQDARTSPRGRPTLVLGNDSRFTHRIFVQDRDRLLVTAGPSSPGRRAGTWIAIQGQLESRPSPAMIFHRWVDGPPRDFQIDLSPWKEKTLELRFMSTPLAPGPSSPESLWIAPRVQHPDAVFELVKTVKDLRFFRNPRALPRALIIHHFRVIPEPKERLDFLASPALDFSRTAVLERDPHIRSLSLSPLLSEAVQVESYRPDLVKFRAGLSADGLLVVSDTYYPGWRAFDRGRELPILRADHAFRAVALDAGRHELEFRYEPASIRLALFVFFPTLLLAGLAAFGSRRRRRSRGPGPTV